MRSRPWHSWADFVYWLRHGLILYWRCCQCGKRHLSSRRFWDDHIFFDAPLCTRCQDVLYGEYCEAERCFIVEQNRDDVCLPREQYEELCAIAEASGYVGYATRYRR